MNCITAPLTELREIEELHNWLKKRQKSTGKRSGALFACGCIDSQKAHFIAGCEEEFAYKLVITFSEARAREIYEDYKCFDENVVCYPAKDFIFYSADIHGNLIVQERMAAIQALLERERLVVIVTIDGCMDKILPLPLIQKNILRISDEDCIDSEKLTAQLVRIGYERVQQVERCGEFAVRGGIIDIFPLTEDVPYRIELWDDEVDSIRTFHIQSQRSIENQKEIVLYPATEIILDEDTMQEGIQRLDADLQKQMAVLQKEQKFEEAERICMIIKEATEHMRSFKSAVSFDAYLPYFYTETVSFLDYFPVEKTLVFLDEPVRIGEKADTLEMEFRESMIHRLEKGYILPKQTEVLYGTKETLARIQKNCLIAMGVLEQKQNYISLSETVYFHAQNINSYNNNFELLVKDLQKYKKQGYRVVLLSNSRTRTIRLAQDLREHELSAYSRESLEQPVQAGEILVTYGYVHRGFEYPQLKFVVITEADIFGAEKKRRKKTTYEGQKIQNFTELSVGDYVVHENHGLGVYQGIEKMEVDGVTKDYIKIEYEGGSKLYMQATQLDLLQKYAGAGAKAPKLNTLGGKEWHKTKSKVYRAVQDIAKELVELYAKRQAKSGFQYGADTVWQREFEETFPYEETKDQLTAIEETKRDMESIKIMDRLICGDVGYGKTEIAIRAAFKAVMENKQVVYLVPTTILAQQHYHTFIERMKNFPIRVDLLSRFRTPSQQKSTLDGLKKGVVDIVIGTHRVLSKDLQYKDLGLLIVDEEQRFGVTHKEKIKKLKENVDVLTLTATPIPRTLHMSLIGIRDMSILEEPPVDRLPIQTYVMEYNDEMVREAINRELNRGGQVYYVYNRVNSIEEVANHVALLVPDAHVKYAHGQMREHQLEKIMYDYINGEIDVLVSTTIIETGLDISNANTMIIHDADQLGLAQLYQLRGRVGRSNRTSYAFLMYKRDKMLKEIAEKRLAAIREFTELGSGFKIAMRDLEIRGAGNILGAEQHGHMEAVGYDLYCKMLNEAVKNLKGVGKENNFETSIDMDVNAFIPPVYIKNEMHKLDVYKRIAGIENEEEYTDMQDELTDRFGVMPKSVENLLQVALLKAVAHRLYVQEVKGNRQEIRITLYEHADLDGTKVALFLEKYRNQMKFKVGKNPYFLYNYGKNDNKSEEGQLGKVAEILGEMGEVFGM